MPEVDDGQPDGRHLARRSAVGVATSMAATNVVGIAAVFVFAVLVLPGEPVSGQGRADVINLVAVAIWTPLAIAVGIVRGTKVLRPARAWLIEDRAPTAAEEMAVLRAPMRLFRLQLRIWLVSAVAFAFANGLMDPRLIPRAGLTTVLGGLTTSAIAYLTTERILRPVAARALAEGTAARPRLPGVTARHLLGWALGTGVPVLGIVIAGIFGAAESGTTRLSLAVTMIALGGTALAVGLWATLLGAKAISDPVASVRAGLERVTEGDLGVEIPVYDGSEVGLLQDGFNKMVEGLRERERIRVVFGRHVGAAVAADALDGDQALGGQPIDVAVLFVDMVASTRMAASNPPDVVVGVLNRFFAVVVACVDANGGWINKFQGDAALAVFGAPRELADPAGSALAAGRELAARLARDVPEHRAGIGVAFGRAVAGNIGAEDRFEYTVIGDPVNEAARLTELAKKAPAGVLASGAAVAAADPDEAAQWAPGDQVTLRGRPDPTVLHRPREQTGAETG